jgi:ubiquinone/menaquinone biosynthesis C-methylase UbiE
MKQFFCFAAQAQDDIKDRMMTISTRHIKQEHLFCCPRCKNKQLSWQPDVAFCKQCQSYYPVKSGVVDFFNNYNLRLSGKSEVSETFLQAVSSHFGFPNTREVQFALKEAIEATQLTALGSDCLTAEIRELASRMGVTLSPWKNETVISQQPIRQDVTGTPEISFIRHYIDSTLPADKEIYRSIRIKNTATTSLLLNPDSPINLSYHWLDEKGRLIDYEGLRSPIPREMQPNDEVTVITKLRTPAAPGNYILRVCSMQEYVAWHDDNYLDIPLSVSSMGESPLSFLPANDLPFDYSSDIAWSQEIIEKQFRTADSNILEIAGGVFPQSIHLAATECNVYSIDISFAMSQIGSLYYNHVDQRYTPDRFLFLCADATALPFQESVFDGIVICAALHHFPDPINLLKDLKKYLRNNGRIVIVREPCQPNPWDIDYLRDIRNGINEQMWTTEEFDFIFRSAGLKIIDGRIDSCSSLKVVLRPLG